MGENVDSLAEVLPQTEGTTEGLISRSWVRQERHTYAAALSALKTVKLVSQTLNAQRL